MAKKIPNLTSVTKSKKKLVEWQVSKNIISSVTKKSIFPFFYFLLFELLFVCLSVSLCTKCLTLCDMLVVLKMNFTMYWEIWIFHINNTFGRSITDVRQVESWVAFGTVMKIACVHLSQKILVHNLKHLNYCEGQL